MLSSTLKVGENIFYSFLANMAEKQPQTNSVQYSCTVEFTLVKVARTDKLISFQKCIFKVLPYLNIVWYCSPQGNLSGWCATLPFLIQLLRVLPHIYKNGLINPKYTKLEHSKPWMYYTWMFKNLNVQNWIVQKLECTNLYNLYWNDQISKF